jgi:hypothetical protein
VQGECSDEQNKNKNGDWEPTFQTPNCKRVLVMLSTG